MIGPHNGLTMQQLAGSPILSLAPYQKQSKSIGNIFALPSGDHERPPITIHQSRITAFLIYGVGIKNPSNYLKIKEKTFSNLR